LLDLASFVRFFHLPEDGVGIAKGVGNTGLAKIGGNNGSATFRQQFKAGAGLTKGLPAPHAGRPGCLLPASCAELHDCASLIHLPTIGINLFISGTGLAKRLGIHVATAIPPHIEFPAIHTQGDGTSVTKHNRRFPAAPLTNFFSICNNHFDGSLDSPLRALSDL
jgi:hypothetical protein